MYPKKEAAKKELFKRLILECTILEIPVYYSLEELTNTGLSMSDFSFVVDAIFGYSFVVDESGIREPFNTIIQTLKKEEYSKVPILCIDIPSGWNVDSEDVQTNLKQGLRCDVLVSLPAPKICAKHFKGKHFIGGRFMPPCLLKEMGIELAKYPGIDIIAELKYSSL